MQEITLIGRIGRDATVYETANGNKFIAFSLAADGRVKGQTVTSWYDIITFDVGKYERMLPYMTKGSSMVVVGELYAEVEKGSDNIVRCRRTVTADLIKFGPKSGSGSTIGEDAVVAKTSSERVSTNASSTKTKAKKEPVVEDIQMGELPTAKGTTPTVATPVNTVEVDDDLPF